MSKKDLAKWGNHPDLFKYMLEQAFKKGQESFDPFSKYDEGVDVDISMHPRFSKVKTSTPLVSNLTKINIPEDCEHLINFRGKSLYFGEKKVLRRQAVHMLQLYQLVQGHPYGNGDFLSKRDTNFFPYIDRGGCMTLGYMYWSVGEAKWYIAETSPSEIEDRDVLFSN